MNIPKIYNEKTGSDDAMNVTDNFREKLINAETPGFQAECDPNEADCAGAFLEDALSEEDALDTAIDLNDAQSGDVPVFICSSNTAKVLMFPRTSPKSMRMSC